MDGLHRQTDTANRRVNCFRLDNRHFYTGGGNSLIMDANLCKEHREMYSIHINLVLRLYEENAILSSIMLQYYKKPRIENGKKKYYNVTNSM